MSRLLVPQRGLFAKESQNYMRDYLCFGHSLHSYSDKNVTLGIVSSGSPAAGAWAYLEEIIADGYVVVSKFWGQAFLLHSVSIYYPLRFEKRSSMDSVDSLKWKIE